jgi:cardiolipin synthase
VYLRDLDNATEIVLQEQHITRLSPATPAAVGASWAAARYTRRRTGRTRRAATAGAIQFGRTFSAALTARRALGAAEAATLLWGVVLFGALGIVGLKWPKGVAYPLGVLFLWIAAGWVIQAVKLWKHREKAAPEAAKTPARQDAA